MKYRKLDSKGDMVFGHGQSDYLQDSPDCVAQAVKTRLGLFTGDWFLDLSEGTPYSPGVLGKHTRDSYDFVLRKRVLDTEGVIGIEEYNSVFDGETRKLTVNVRIDSVYGPAEIQETM